MKTPNLEWNVFVWDINTDEFVKLNILKDNYLISKLKKTKFKNYEELKEVLDQYFKSRYWSRTEYEYFIQGMFSRKKPKKVDVYYQIKLNLDRITEYLIVMLHLKRKDDKNGN